MNDCRRLWLNLKQQVEAVAGQTTRRRRKCRVDATGFTGNLATTDDDVQTALATIDALDLGGSGGGGGGSTDRIVLLDGVTYSPGAARNFDLTEAVDGPTPSDVYDRWYG